MTEAAQPQRSPHRRRSAAVAMAVVVVALAAAWTALVPALQRARHGADRVPVGDALRVFAQGMNALHAEDLSQDGTAFMLFYHRVVEPETLFMTQRSSIPAPPMPTIDAFNYEGITARDSYERTVTREQIVAAAKTVLGDEPWERIGSLRLLRAPFDWWARDAGLVIVGFAFNEVGSGRYVWIVRADGSARHWHATDPELQAKLTTAIEAAESAGVAPPPQELIDFINAPTTTR